MAHLLVIENWVEGTGRLLPQAIKRLGHDYTFVTRNPAHYSGGVEVHPIFEHASHLLTLETNDTSALIAALREIHSDLQFDGVLTICDYYIGTVAQVADALELPQAFSSNVVNIRQKHRVRQALEAAGLANPRFVVTHEWLGTRAAAEAIGYPLVIKPTDLASSAFVKLVHNEAELAEAFSQLHSFTENFRGQIREPIWLLEEYMDGEEVSVEAWTLDGKTTVLGITDKSLTGFPYFIEDGHMFPADLDEQQAQAIEDYLVAVLRAVGHDHGVSHTEIKLTAQGLRVVEINSRPAGNFIAELIEHVTGFNLLDIHINLALGIGPQLQAPIQRQGSAAITFFVPPTEGIGREMTGLESLDHNPQLVRWQFKPVKDMKINSPIDNACYLGHVIARDTNGRRARHYAEQALQQLSLHYREGSDNKLITEDV